MMTLELLTQRPASPARATPILFVHGAWCAAWCWAEHFLPYFAARGYIAYALSLRGHGGSEGREHLPWTSIMDYVADVEQVVAQLERTPVLVGHSMGGFVVQHYLSWHDAPAAVLMASVPHKGLSWHLVLNTARRNLPRLGRALLTRRTLPLAPLHETASYFFAGGLPAEQLQVYAARLQDESPRVVWEMLGRRLPRPGGVKTPMLVLAAGNDRFLSPAEMYGLAHAYTADLEVVPDIGHVMMLDVTWERAAERIVAWLEKQKTLGG